MLRHGTMFQIEDDYKIKSILFFKQERHCFLKSIIIPIYSEIIEHDVRVLIRNSQVLYCFKITSL